MDIVLYILLGLILAAGIVVFMLVSVNNRLVALDGRCDTAFSDIDAQLKHRQNLIPGLVETVRGFASQERDILNKVTAARSAALAASAPDQRINSEKLLSKTIVSLMAVAERYPELNSSLHFAELRAELVDAENRITAARRFYNLAIEEYNTTLRQFPGSYIASLRNLGKRRPFDLGVERVFADEAVAFKF